MKSSLKTALLGASLLMMTSVSAQASQICENYASDGYAYNAYPAKNNADLSKFKYGITSITGTIHGQNWTTGMPDTRAISTTGTNWQNGGYLSSNQGPTGGWKSAFFNGSNTTNFATGTDLIDIRFGANDGIHPGKSKAPSGTQPLYVVQRNRDMGQKNKGITLAGFKLTICGEDCGGNPTNC
jgi:hypothetical protein